MNRLLYAIFGLLFLAGNACARTSITVLDFGATDFGKLAAARVRAQLRAKPELLIADADLSRSAASGLGYTGSLNLTVTEARDLGAALATDFYLLGDGQILRRSSFAKPVYYEAYCSIFLVSARTGRLLRWERPSFEDSSATQARDLLLKELTASGFTEWILSETQRATLDERREHAITPASPAPLIEEAPEDEKTAAAQGVRLPRPFKRIRPEYPASAARAEVEATVDVLVDIGTGGEVDEVEVVRWAGFGLDEATVATVRQMEFFPAMRDGAAIPMRVLLRYNFRKPPPDVPR